MESKINDVTSIAPRGRYTVSFNFDPSIAIAQGVSGKDILEQAGPTTPSDIIQDHRLKMIGFILDYRTISTDQIILNYVGLLASLTNQNITSLLQNRDVEVLRSIGYIIAFAAPTSLAEEVGRFENRLANLNIPFLKERAFHPLSTFSQHYADIWVSKLDAAKAMRWEGSPAVLHSTDLVNFLIRGENL